MNAIQLIIKGKVQGVYFRASAKQLADQLGLNGWVYNATGGEVEIVVSGSPEAVEQFIKWCRKGPALADVQDVLVRECMQQESQEGFRIRH